MQSYTSNIPDHVELAVVSQLRATHEEVDVPACALMQTIEYGPYELLQIIGAAKLQPKCISVVL